MATLLASVEERVLEIVGRLVVDLGGPGADRRIALDDSLERDLGIGSLERVELFVRLEKDLGAALGEDVMAEAETVRDLVQAVRAAPGAIPAPAVTAALGSRPALAPALAAPSHARSLPEVLACHAAAHGDRTHAIFPATDGAERHVTYGELWQRARAIAGGLRGRGLRAGDRVALMLPTGEEFLASFLGALVAGGVPVPLYPPFRRGRLIEYARRQAGILANAEARWLITFEAAVGMAGILRARVPTLDAVATVADLGGGAPWDGPSDLAGDDPALIQYTSGSTGDPKGVLLSHTNVLANIRAIGEAIAIAPDDVGVSWLPLYHDMGLIGSWLGALYFGIPIVLLSPLAFLARPAVWLQAIDRYHGTVSPAPNFAFDLCVRKTPDEARAGLDLSSWRLALNGSEPVSAGTIERFTHHFAPCGFRPEAMCPVYGLAENAVALTVPPLGRRPRVDRIARDRFQREREAHPALADSAAPLAIVSCGRPLPGHEVRIVDAQARTVPDRSEGRIQFRGPSMMRGYYRNPDATRQGLCDGWIDTGDLGYLAEGELFVTGRSKDLVIKAGRNLHPQEIEEITGDVPGVRKGCVAAFGVPDPELGTERLVVAAESRWNVPADLAALRAAIVARVADAIGLPPDVVAIYPPGSVPRTSSGKIRRAAARTAFLEGRLGRVPPSARVEQARLALGAVWARARAAGALAARLVFTGYVGLVGVLTLPALWLLVRLLPPGRRVDRVVRRWCRLAFALAGCPLRLDGASHLQGLERAVLVANHSSYLDVPALLATLPIDCRFVAKRELLRWPVVGTVIARAGHPTVERADRPASVADAERATAVLRAGTSLLVFPEGTFVRERGILPFRLGAFKAAVDTATPVVPVAIDGTRHMFPADARLLRRGPITVAVGHPLAVRASGWQEMVRLRDEAREEIARCTGEPQLDRRPPP